MPRLKTLWVLLPALLSLGPGAASLAGAGGPTAWAGGTVVDETGRPVAEARVELLRLISWEDGVSGSEARAPRSSAGDETKPDRGYRALSGADGRFRIPDLPADTGFTLRVVQRGFTVLVQRGIDSPAAGGQIALGTLRLPKVPTVAGRVVDSKGRPLAGAQVWALSAQDLELRQRGDVPRIRDPEAPVARTGPDGRFAIPRFEPGILEICGKGLAPARVSSLAPGRNRIVLTPPPPSSWFSGRVVDGEGLPVAKAKVYLSLSASSSISDRDSSELLVKIRDRLWNPCAPRPSLDEAVPVYDLASYEQELVALSDREGRFRFELIVELELSGDMMVNVRAEAAGYLKQGSPRVSNSLRSPGKVELVLERGATVSGRVLTAQGLPAAAADLEIGDDGSETHHWTVQTDSAGRYSVTGIKPGTWDLSVQHPSGKMRRRLVVARGENRPPDLVLDGDGTRQIRGRVTGPDGAGIAGASVAISFVPSLRTGSDGTSGPDGSFHLDFRSSRAAGKTLAVDVAKIGFTSSHLRLDPAAAVASPLKIRLDPGLRLTGHIVGVDAEDLPNVFVTAVQDGKDYDSRVSRDGEFRIAGLEPGEIAVTAFIGSGRLPCGSARVTLEPGTEETVLNLEIPAVTEARGMVLAPDGTPLADASVVFQSAQESPACAQPTSATSEDDGSFSTWLQAGRYTVLGRAPGYSPTVQEAPLTVGRDPVEGLEVRLGSPGIILGGRLLGLNPEEEEIAVSVKASTGTVESTAQIAADGAYRFDDLGPGDWSVQAEEVYLGQVFRRMSRRVKLKTGQADATLDFNIAGTLSLSLRFTGAEDKLSYTLVLSQPEAGWETVEETHPQSDPVYRLTRLPAGKYRLRIKDYQHDRTFERPVVLTADQEMVIDLSTPAGAGSS